MFYRATVAVVAIAAAASVLVGVAGASPADVIWFSSNNGPIAYAEASWETRSATAITDVGVLAAKTHRASAGTTGPGGGAATHIFFELRTMYLDVHGQPTGGVDVSGNASGDVPFIIDDRSLTLASVNTAVSTRTCTLDAAGNPTSCADGGRMNVSASWNGHGPISRGSSYEDHLLAPGGFVLIDRASGTFRLADATSTIGGQTFDAAAETMADMGNNVQLTVLMCPHGC